MDVAGAARHTLASGSARVWQCTFAEPLPPPERSSTTYAEGVADLASVRVRMRKRLPPAWEGDNRIRRVTWKRPYRQPSPREPGPSLGEVVAGIGALWRRKRAYERGQSA